MIGFQGVGGRMLALLALPLFDYASGGKPGSHGIAWCFFALIILFAWRRCRTPARRC